MIDAATGDPVAMASITLTAASGTPTASLVSNKFGLFDLENVEPGRYQIDAVFAGQPLRVRNVTITAGRMTYVDLVFTLGSVEPLEVDYGDPTQAAITRFAPRNLAPNTGLIEGTVSAFGTHERIAGAVVTAVPNSGASPLQTITDDAGRYRFADVTPGVYAVSAYYSMAGRGQIEVLRSSIDISSGEGVRVPLAIELSQ